MAVKKHVLSLITLSVALAIGSASAFAADSTTTSKPTTQLVSTYGTFAGSEANATALINGLRNGTSITLTSGSSTTGTTTTGTTTAGTTTAGATTTGTTTAGTTTAATGTVKTTFTPATSKLGYGNINIALSLAQAELTKLGIANPTPAQLQAALNGGTVTTSKGTTTLPGVLQLRSEGMGWGGIAKSLGFKLGSVVSASKTEKSEAATERHDGTEKDKSVAKVDKSSTTREPRAERVAKAERPERIERLEKAERPERIERPEKVERPERIESTRR